MKTLFRQFTSATWVALALGVAVSQPALAQDEDEAAADLGRVTVTGSRIPRTQAEGPSPVVLITRDDIDKAGYDTVQNVFDNLVQNTSGSVSQSQTFGFTPGASSPQLRGFDAGKTLVLIDGRRPAVYPLGLGSEETFVDLASIPLSKIERIEILTDGASAIYGADAIAGVVNIITRKDIQGLNISARMGNTADGGYDNQRIQVLAGATTGKTSVSVTGEFYYNEELRGTDRDWADSDIPSGRSPAEIPLAAYSIGGASFLTFDDFTTVQAPGCGTPSGPLGGLGIPNQASGVVSGLEIWCGFDRSKFRFLYPENEQVSLTGNITHEVSPDIEFFAETFYSRRETFNQQEPNFYGATAGFTPGPSDAVAQFPSSVTNNGLLLGAEPNNPLPGRPGIFVRRVVEMGPRINNIEFVNYGALAGFRGTLPYEGLGWFNSWDWEVGLAYNYGDFSSRRPNFIISSFENEIINNGLDLFQPIPQATIDKIAFTATTDAFATNTTWDGTLSGDLPLELPGGPLGVAIHYDHESQRFEDDRDELVVRGDAFDGATEAAGERKHYGIGAEFLLPVHSMLEISLAARFDEYSDASLVDRNTSPRIAVAFRPFDRLLVRASAGESFRAPSLQQLFGSQTRAFQSVIDTPLCVSLGGTPNDPNSPFFQCNTPVQSVQILQGGNPRLRAEEGENLNFGVVVEPIDDLSFTIDYYSIKVDDLAATLSEQFLLDQCAATGQFCQQIFRDPQGTLQGGRIENTFVNVAKQNIDGIDFSADYRLETARFGAFDFAWDLAWVNSFETQANPTLPVTENVKLGSLPEYRWNLVANWERGNHGATFRVHWVDELPYFNCQTNPDGSCVSNDFVDDYMVSSGQYRYDFGRWGRLAVGINNLFDADLPVDPTVNLWPFVPGTVIYSTGLFYDIYGRSYYARYELDF